VWGNLPIQAETARAKHRSRLPRLSVRQVESSPGAVFGPLELAVGNQRQPLARGGGEHALCARRAAILGSLLTQESNDRSENDEPKLRRLEDRGSDHNHIRV
jgi:hypothetical protein